MTRIGTPEERYIVPGLERGLQMLDCFTRDRPEWTLSELAARLDVPVSSAFRVAYTLEAMGFLIRKSDGGKEYRLGRRLLSLGFEYLNSLELVEVARSFLSALRETTGLSAQLAIRDGREIVYLIRISGRMRLNPDISVGTRLPAHAASVGRVLLSEMPGAEIEALYRGVALTPVSSQTATTLPQLFAMLDADRARGFVLSDGGFFAGLVSLATGVRDSSGQIVAAISLSGTDSAIPAEQWEGDFLAALLDAAQEISGMLGYRSRPVSGPSGRGT